MKTFSSYLRLIFLLILLIANIIGFSYFFRPISQENILRIPANSKFVLTLNLKSVSGKLFTELIFNPESFGSDIISTKERKLVFSNSSNGIELFSHVALFSFPFHDKMYSGISFCIYNTDLYQKNLENRSMKKNTVDGIQIFYNDWLTYFIYEKSVVIVFSELDESLSSEMAVMCFRNESAPFDIQSGNDFKLILNKGLLEGNPLASLFRMLPDWVTRFEITGDFNRESISMNGKLIFNKKYLFIQSAKFDKPTQEELKQANLQFIASGKMFENLIHEFLIQGIDPKKDSLGLFNDIFEKRYSTMSLSTNKVLMNTNVFDSGSSRNLFFPNLVLKMKLGAENPPVSFMEEKDITPYLNVNTDSNPGKVHLMVAKLKPSRNIMFGYFNVQKFLKESEINFFVKAFTDPLLILNDILFYTEKIEDSTIYFSGKVQLKDANIHSIIQMRALFRQLTAVI